MLEEITVIKRDGSKIKLSELKAKVLLIVNTATWCGFTPQYSALEDLYQKYHDKGLEILDFPCDQFGHQAPGSDEEIHNFCTAKYHTTFLQLKKIEVNGEFEDKLYTYLKEKINKDTVIGVKNKLIMEGIKKISKTCKKKNDIVWNFTKFLVDKEGNVKITDFGIAVALSDTSLTQTNTLIGSVHYL